MRQVGQFNASSQADIAFLLLVFFLVTTSMSSDQGLYRLLPPPADPNNTESDKINERNVFVVLINKDNQLAVESKLADIYELKDRTIEFIDNPANKENLSEKVMASTKRDAALAAKKEEEANNYNKLIAKCGDIPISKGVVSIQNDRGTKYDIYIQVQNEILAAYNECRDKFSSQYFGGKKYDDLSKDEQTLVKLVYPLSISEAEPKNIK